MTAGGAGAAALFERLIDAGAGGGEGGDQSAEQAGEDREAKSKGNDRPVERDRFDAWEVFGEIAEAEAQRCRGNEQTQKAAGEAKNKRLDQELAKHGGAAGPERDANGDFALPAHDANQQQAGEVGAGDEKDNGYSEEEDADQRAGSEYRDEIERLD